ncbi:3-phenylpropionate-dihydrodiol_cinnamic acid-dihydrodiol dehydrogenase [Nocardiopsis dassonvillei]|uniref:SDR family NAD(P)-dependent oxidoreductase n=1 Tax=Nocardiopsis dassonvillei TaxID=2014 RepID=UPI003F554538
MTKAKTVLVPALAARAVSRLRRDGPGSARRRRRGGVLPWAVAGAALGTGAAALAPRPHTTRLTGRVALVTGGSRGLGLAMAREFGERGASVVVCARDADELDRAVADLEARGIPARGFPCDVRDPGEAERLVEKAEAAFGHLDFVVNNAGIIQVGPQEVLTEEHFREAMETMFWAPLRISRAAVGPLSRTGGSLVTITSIGGHLSVPHLLPYSCAKFAEVALSEGLGAELARRGVRVTTVVPGLMRTGSHRAAVFSGNAEREYSWFALGAGLPLVSSDAGHAARRIVEAAARGRPYLVITPLAAAVVAARGLCPSLVQRLMRVMAGILPGPPEEPREMRGAEADAGLVNEAVRTAAVLNERAADGLNQEPRRKD